MKSRTLLVHGAAGAVAGAAAGPLAAWAIALGARHFWAAMALSGAAGAILAAGGALASRTARGVPQMVLAGLISACAAYLAAREAHIQLVNSASALALGYVILILAVSCVIGSAHAAFGGQRDVAFPAGIFGAIGGLVGLAAGARLFWSGQTVPLLAAAAGGAFYGTLLWASISLAKGLFGVDAERYRV